MIRKNKYARASAIALASLAFSFLALTARPAHGMEVRGCDDVRVFIDTPVNILILPYTYATDARRTLSEPARQMTLLMQQDSLLEMVKYERIGLVNLIQLPGGEQCDPDKIWAQTSGGAGPPAARIRNGAGVVMVWGRIFEEDKQLFVQTFVRFVRVGVTETINRTIPGADGPALFRGALPSHSIAFPSRRVTYEDLSGISRAFERASRVHQTPSESSPVVRVSDLSGDTKSFQPFGYFVTEVRGDWMKVGSLYGGPPGWIRARARQSWPLRDRMPELYFIDALTGT